MNTRDRKTNRVITILCVLVVLSTVYGQHAVAGTEIVQSSAGIGDDIPPAVSRLAEKYAEASDLYGDRRVREWSKLYREADKRELLGRIEDNLRSDSPHPLAPYAWSVTKRALGELTAGETPSVPADLSEPLGPTPGIYSFYEAGQPARALAAGVGREDAIRGPWGWMMLVWSADELGMTSRTAVYAREMVRRYPGDYGVAWTGENELGQEWVARDTRRWLAENPGIAATPAGHHLSWALAHPLRDDAEDYANAMAWLQHSRADPRALRDKAHQLWGSKRYRDALDAYRASERAFPFYENWRDIGGALIHLRRGDEAREYATASAARDYPERAVERIAAYRYGAMAEEAGHYGIAREAWARAAERWPGDREITLALARLSLAEGFPAEAEERVRSLFDADSTDAKAAELLAESLREQERYGEALGVLDSFHENGGTTNQDLLYEYWKAAREVGRNGALAKLFALAEGAEVDKAWVQQFLAVAKLDAGDASAGFESLRKAIALDPFNSWYLSRLVDAAEASGRQSELAEFMDRLKADVPYEEDVWEVAAELAGEGNAADVWDEAIAASPGLAFPYVERAKLAEGWRDKREILTRGLEHMKEVAGPYTQRARLHEERSYVADEAYRTNEARDPAVLQQALDDLESMRADFGDLGDYWRSRYHALSRTHDTKAMVEALLQWERTEPSSRAWRKFHTQRVREELNIGRAFEALHRAISRRPRDLDMLRNGAGFHLKWGGSPVVAIEYAQRIKRDYPAVSIEGTLKEAYGELGAHKEYYLEIYGNASRIAPSGRYVDWFEAARERARSGNEATLESIDTEKTAVTLLRSDGMTEERRYDPVSGRLVHVRIGAAEMTIDYTARHDLEAITVGGRRMVKLEYTEATGYPWVRPVSAIEIPGEPRSEFSYDNEEYVDKPTTIRVEETGRIDVRYDSDTGEIAGTSSTLVGGDIQEFELASTVTRVMQELSRYATLAGQASSIGFDDLPYEDPELESLRARARGAESLDESLPAWLDVGRYLLDHLDDRAEYASEAEGIAAAVFDEVRAAEEGAFVDFGISAIAQWHELQAEVRPEGLPIQQWKRWNRMRDWMNRAAREEPGLVKRIEEIRARNRSRPLRLLSNDNWLARSYIDNPGYWNRYARHEVVPAELARDVKFNDLLARRDGTIVVGSNRGLSVLRNGYWEWFSFDEKAVRWTRNGGYEAAGAESSVTALAEDHSGRLWVGTETGLVVLPESYEKKATYWRGAVDGIPGGRVNDLAPHGNGVVVAGAGGSRLWDLDGPGRALAGAAGEQAADFVRSYPRDGGGTLTLLGTRNGVFAEGDGRITQLVDGRYRDAYWNRESGRLMLLRGGMMYRADYDGQDGLAGEPRPVPRQETIVHSGTMFGLAPVPLDDEGSALAVLTDQGMSLYRDYHFEHKKVPLADRTLPIVALDETGGRIFMLTGEGVASIERGQVRTDRAGRVHDLASDPDSGVTYVARGNSLEAVFHDAPRDGTHLLAVIDATRLALDEANRLVANDGHEIVRFESPGGPPRKLFSARPTVPEGWAPGEVTSILVDSGGTIWVTAGSSLFNWREGDEQPTEYSIFVDYQAFPVDSDMLEQVIETRGGAIWVVASDEGHRLWRGKSLEGGLFRLRDGEWERIGGSFVTSYTAVADERAIVGTASGFAQHREGDRLVRFAGTGDATYDALKRRQNALFLGTDGARIGDGLWLFGAAAGLVAYKDGTWFYPDRINWMLPGQEFANYGSRVVHAVATDSQGRVYAGTDLGLMVYDPMGASAETFLVSNRRRDYAFQVLEQRKMREVNDVLLDALDPESEAGRLVERYRRTQDHLEELKRKIAKVRKLSAPAGNESGADTDDAAEAPEGESGTDAGNAQQLKQKIRRREKAQVALLARLERDKPALFQMLRLNPLDLKALRRDMDPDTVIVQYLPADRQLYINLVGREMSELRTVDVTREELMSTAATVGRSLAAQVRDLRIRGAEAMDQSGADSGSRGAVTTLSPEETIPGLAWLYDRLVRPIEHDIADKDHVLVVPAGQLSYVPFAALVRRHDGDSVEYAVQDHSIGVMPTLYTYQVMRQDLPSTAFGHLVFGDSDGSLPGARREAREISELLQADAVETRVGAEATYEALTSHARDARFLHLAVHGKLNHEAPERSYLQLADGHQLSLSEAMILPLEETELVFLSACESGLGRNGLEYRTLAQAFAHAGAPTVVATLWEVNDAVARELANGFYQRKLDGADHLDAMAAGQRELIDRGGARAQPAAWAPFTVFGKP